MRGRTAFLDYLAHERRLSPNTVAAYRRDLDAFATELARHGIDDPRRVDEHHVRGLITRRHRQGLGPRSIQRLLSAIRSYYRYLMREGLADANPAAAVKAPRAGKKLPATLDTDTVARLLDFEPRTPLEIRDKAMLELFVNAYQAWMWNETLSGLLDDIGASHHRVHYGLGEFRFYERLTPNNLRYLKKTMIPALGPGAEFASDRVARIANEVLAGEGLELSRLKLKARVHGVFFKPYERAAVMFPRNPVLSRADRTFCTTCGSSLPWRTKNGRWVVVPAGSLNDDPQARPERNIFWDSRPEWSLAVGDLPTFAEIPPRE